MRTLVSFISPAQPEASLQRGVQSARSRGLSCIFPVLRIQQSGSSQIDKHCPTSRSLVLHRPVADKHWLTTNEHMQLGADSAATAINAQHFQASNWCTGKTGLWPSLAISNGFRLADAPRFTRAKPRLFFRSTDPLCATRSDKCTSDRALSQIGV